MSSRFPTTIRLSLDELARHGGGTGPHGDGWGIGLHDGSDAFLVREPEAAHASACVRFLHERALRTSIAIAHIRKATQGERLLRNTQPFARELGGRLHLFAHNGMLTGIEADRRFAPRRFRPIGETDSEYAFCALLEDLAALWDSGVPTLEHRVRKIHAFATEIRSLGPANFLYTDGDVIIAHGHRRKHADGATRSPGLHVLGRTCTAVSDAVSLAGIAIDADAVQDVAIVASVPLSAEPWEQLADGEIVVLQAGRVVRRIAP